MLRQEPATIDVVEILRQPDITPRSTTTSHVVNGATYTAVHAQLPAKTLLIVISIIAAGLFIGNIWAKGWTLPVIAGPH